MKRVFKNPIFTFIFGVIATVGIGYSVYAISASEIEYGNTTVEGALNDLYDKAIKTLDLTSKTTASTNGNCYSLQSVTGTMYDNILFIRLRATKVVEDCNTPYVIDISDLGLSTITYKSNFDLASSTNYRFNNVATNVNSITLGVDTNYGYGTKNNYDYGVYYYYTK